MIYHENREYQSGLPIHATFFRNFNFSAHWHSEIEVTLVCEGSIVMGINSESRVLQKGDFAICTSGDIHHYEKGSADSTVLIIVFRPELIDSIVKLPYGTRFAYPFIDKSIIDNIGIKPSVLEEINYCFNYIYKEVERCDKHYQVIVKSRLIELIGLFLRHLPQQSVDMDRYEATGGTVQLVQKAIKYIELNYAIGITLEDVSKHLGISPAYFSKIFSKVTGHNFKTYLNTIRVEKVNNFLKSSSDSIIDIAYECGFNSIRTFNRVFKSIKGFSPSDVR